MYKLQLAILVAFCALFSSCKVSNLIVQGSLDGNRDYQGGPSGTVSKQDFAWNIMSECVWGAPISSGPLRSVNSAVGRDWLPQGYEPEAPSAGGQLVMVSSLEFVQRAAKFDGYSQRLNYLVAIQDVRYLYPLGNSGTLFGGLGPYIGYGLGGSTGSGANKAPAFGSDGYKRFDWGLHFTAGYQLPSSLNFRFAYELGLYDKSTNPSDWTSYNRTWSIGIGYSLDKIIHGLKK
jgi:hypothetical protein